MSEDSKKKLKYTELELVKVKSDVKLIEEKLDYCQSRLLDIRNEKNNLLKKINEYDLLDINSKLEEVNILKNDFLKQKHRLQITKELLDDSREEIILLNRIIDDFKNLSFFDFIRNKYPDSLNHHYIKYEKYSKYNQHKKEL